MTDRNSTDDTTFILSHRDPTEIVVIALAASTDFSDLKNTEWGTRFGLEKHTPQLVRVNKYA